MSAISWLAGEEALLCPLTYPLHDLPNVFNDYFLQKVQSIRADLDQQSVSLTSCRPTDQQAASNFHSFQPLTEAELKATILKSKPTSCSLDLLPTSLLLEFDDLLHRNNINLVANKQGCVWLTYNKNRSLQPLFSMTIFFRKSSLFVLILISSHCHLRAVD